MRSTGRGFYLERRGQGRSHKAHGVELSLRKIKDSFGGIYIRLGERVRHYFSSWLVRSTEHQPGPAILIFHPPSSGKQKRTDGASLVLPYDKCLAAEPQLIIERFTCSAWSILNYNGFSLFGGLLVRTSGLFERRESPNRLIKTDPIGVISNHASLLCSRW